VSFKIIYDDKRDKTVFLNTTPDLQDQDQDHSVQEQNQDHDHSVQDRDRFFGLRPALS